MLFSERYADLIGTELGQMVDNICGGLEYNLKVRLSDVMHDFAEPQKIYLDRYSSYDVTTTALEMAVNNFNEIKGVPYISLKHNVFDGPIYDPLANAFTPFLFDVIELQYQELSSGEKVDFQAEINTAFAQYNAPWLLCEGRMIKIDATQFELDLRQKTLEIMGELKGNDLKFQAAYEELLQSCESFEKDDVTAAISNAGKSYESVLKVICNCQKGNADRLTRTYMEMKGGTLPASMTPEGFREKVMMALPFVRNNSSSDHGAGAIPTTISRPLAKLAINLAAALNTYLIEEYKIELASHDEGHDSDTTSDKEQVPF